MWEHLNIYWFLTCHKGDSSQILQETFPSPIVHFVLYIRYFVTVVDHHVERVIHWLAFVSLQTYLNKNHMFTLSRATPRGNFNCSVKHPVVNLISTSEYTIFLLTQEFKHETFASTLSMWISWPKKEFYALAVLLFYKWWYIYCSISETNT